MFFPSICCFALVMAILARLFSLLSLPIEGKYGIQINSFYPRLDNIDFGVADDLYPAAIELD